jgi:hypothetical protein
VATHYVVSARCNFLEWIHSATLLSLRESVDPGTWPRDARWGQHCEIKRPNLVYSVRAYITSHLSACLLDPPPRSEAAHSNNILLFTGPLFNRHHTAWKMAQLLISRYKHALLWGITSKLIVKLCILMLLVLIAQSVQRRGTGWKAWVGFPASKPALGPTQHLIQGVTEALSPGV